MKSDNEVELKDFATLVIKNLTETQAKQFKDLKFQNRLDEALITKVKRITEESRSFLKSKFVNDLHESVDIFSKAQNEKLLICQEELNNILMNTSGTLIKENKFNEVLKNFITQQNDDFTKLIRIQEGILRNVSQFRQILREQGPRDQGSVQKLLEREKYNKNQQDLRKRKESGEKVEPYNTKTEIAANLNNKKLLTIITDDLEKKFKNRDQNEKNNARELIKNKNKFIADRKNEKNNTKLNLNKSQDFNELINNLSVLQKKDFTRVLAKLNKNENIYAQFEENLLNASIKDLDKLQKLKFDNELFEKLKVDITNKTEDKNTLISKFILNLESENKNFELAINELKKKKERITIHKNELDYDKKFEDKKAKPKQLSHLKTDLMQRIRDFVKPIQIFFEKLGNYFSNSGFRTNEQIESKKFIDMTSANRNILRTLEDVEKDLIKILRNNRTFQDNQTKFEKNIINEKFNTSLNLSKEELQLITNSTNEKYTDAISKELAKDKDNPFHDINYYEYGSYNLEKLYKEFCKQKGEWENYIEALQGGKEVGSRVYSEEHLVEFKKDLLKDAPTRLDQSLPTFFRSEKYLTAQKNIEEGIKQDIQTQINELRAKPQGVIGGITKEQIKETGIQDLRVSTAEDSSKTNLITTKNNNQGMLI